MASGRNDPCPCGSGRKYKHCCMARDANRIGPLPPELAKVASAAQTWEADVLPLTARFQDDPEARPAVVLVMAGEVVLHADVVRRPPAEPEELAGLMEAAVVASAARVGVLPRRLRVRHRELVAPLSGLLAPREVQVRASRKAGQIDRFVWDVDGARELGLVIGHAANPATWAGWGLRRERVAEIFAAAADFYRAAPWKVLDNLQLLKVDTPAGQSWMISVLGNAGEEFGLALYSNRLDLLRLLDADDPEEALDWMEGRGLVLTFEHVRALPKAMRKEIARSGWPVADDYAYPVLLTLNAPGGGVPERDAADLVAVLRGVPGLVAARGDAVARREPAAWTDPATGVRFEHLPLEDEDALAVPPLWDPPEVLAPGFAGGPGARPDDRLRPVEVLSPADLLPAAEREALDGFTASLEAQGLAPATVARHRANAELFLDYLLRWQGVPLRAVHEFDLRTFLYDWSIRKAGVGVTRLDALPGSLKRFFDGLARAAGLDCPWAGPILADRDAFAARRAEFVGGAWWEQPVREWVGELYDDLEARAMLPANRLDERTEFGVAMGQDQARMKDELTRRWLLWRDETIRSGVDRPSAVRSLLARRQLEWAGTPQAALGGRTPAQVVRAEQEEHPIPPDFPFS